ncbi:MAG TPA: hypothetical protein PKD85_07560, partial [Saprospiraceae bacterium]|nr:hypothetical protein [Saprospiraceae bacterium]
SWIEQLGSVFSIHRTFSWALLLVSGYVAYKNKFKGIEALIFSLVVALFFMGIGFVYLEFPAIIQPIHLFISMVLITVVASNIMADKIR